MICSRANNKTQARNTRVKDKGIVWVPSKNKYRVQIGVNGKTRYVGLVADLEEARKMRKTAEEKYWKI